MNDESIEFHPHSTLVGFGLVALEILVLIPASARLFPGPYAPGSLGLWKATGYFAAVAAGKLYGLASCAMDPFGYGTAYSFALMVLCVEVWFSEDPELFNGTKGKGYPIHVFHAPNDAKTKADVPLKPYARIFGAWHAGGVCLCFWMHVLGKNFSREKSCVALALGLLWFCWAAINTWRSVYGAAQFCQAGILFHSLTGPGCGMVAYWMLWYWQTHRGDGGFSEAESVLLGSVGAFGLCTLVWLLTHERREAGAEPTKKQE